MLNGQQMRRPSGVSSDLLINSLGTLGPRPRFLVFPLPFPLFLGAPLVLPLGLGAVSSCFLFKGPGLGVAFGAAALAAKGSKWKVTVGLVNTVGMQSNS